MPPSPSRPPKSRPILVWTTACIIAVSVLVYFGTHGIPRLHQDAFAHLRPPSSSPSKDQTDDIINPAINFTRPGYWSFDYNRDSKNYGLSEEQCLNAFPLLFDEVDRAVAFKRTVGDVTVEEVETASRQDHVVRALIRKNELYIIDAQGVWKDEFRLRSLATLSSLNRAIMSYEGHLPDIEFTMSFGDTTMPSEDSEVSTWTYARLSSEEGLFLMPSFGFWSSPSTGLRSYTEFRSILENGHVDFLDKTPKLGWRGDTRSEMGRGLLKESEGQDWSAVKSIDWRNEREIRENLLSTDDLCTFMFAAAVEGNRSVGRLEYLLNCNNVVLAHERSRIEHFHHLLAPSGDYQNYIKLKHDFSDLRRTISSFLEPSNLPGRTRQIAENARRMFRERYLTPAAEACYWRALIRGWESVQAFQPRLWIDGDEAPWHAGGSKKVKSRPRGVPFESYALIEDIKWDVPAEGRHICVGG